MRGTNMNVQGVEETIYITNASEIRVDSLKSVLDYSDEHIVFKLKNYSVKITGDSLNIKEFTDGDALVEGKIFSVTFLYY
jgi:sporulation protein YqfC